MRRYGGSSLDRLNELRLSGDLPTQLAAASKNIKTAISRINYAWNLQNSPIFRLPNHLVLRIFEHLQGLAYETPSRTHPRWWDWLKVTSVCRQWWRISVNGSSLWENVRIHYKMPVSFLELILDRARGRRLSVQFRSRDYFHSRLRREGYLWAIRPIAASIKDFTAQIRIPVADWGKSHLLELFAIPGPNLESLDLSYDAFYNPPSWSSGPKYLPDISGSDARGRAVLKLIYLVPTAQLKRLTLRHTRGWPASRFGNLTHLTLFGYADGTALAKAVPANPALQKLKLESIKHKRYTHHPGRLVKLDGQTLELARCEPGVLSMFTLSPTCSLVITKTVDQNAIAYTGEVMGLQWLPNDISTVRCLHEIEEVRFSVTRVPGRKGWTAAEQKTIGYSASHFTPGSDPEPSVTFILTYHYDASAPLYEVPFHPKNLLPHPTSWGRVTRASFDGFYGQFGIRDNSVLEPLPNLRSLTLRRCDSGYLVRFITPDQLQGLETLRIEEELSGARFGDTLRNVFQLRRGSAGLWLKDLEIVTSGDPSSFSMTGEQMTKLKECVYRVQVTRAPGYRSVQR